MNKSEKKRYKDVFKELNTFAFGLQTNGINPRVLAIAFIEIGININREFLDECEFKSFILNLVYEYEFQSSKKIN
tara:strand:+ start:239 stop:463 length:225 start_codon:yes stop_codon:yes gene_type:complete